MTNTITINKQDLDLKQYKGQRVITFKDIDRVHNRPDGTAGRNFRANRQHFIENEDYFSIRLTNDEIRRQFGAGKNAGKTMIVITESGYLMLAKSLTDDLSWEVQRQLVKTYFHYKEQPKLPNPKPYEYFDKKYNGVPVLTVKDVEYITKIKVSTINWFLRTNAILGKDYYILGGDELKSYKRDNPKTAKTTGVLNIVTRNGFVKICKAYGIQVEEPKCFAKKKDKVSTVRKIFDTFKKYYDIESCAITGEIAGILNVGKDGIVNESTVVKLLKDDKYKMFIDTTAPLLERQFMVAENLGHIISGHLRENANADINYNEEARLFAVVVMAMSLFFDK